MSKRSPARIPYIPLFGTIAQFQLNTKNIRLTYPGISKQKAWERFKAIINRKGLYNGSSIIYSVYNFKSNIVNFNRVYKFPVKISECIR